MNLGIPCCQGYLSSMPVSTTAWRQRIGLFYNGVLLSAKSTPQIRPVPSTSSSQRLASLLRHMLLVPQFLPFKVLFGVMFLLFYCSTMLLSFILVSFYGLLSTCLFYLDLTGYWMDNWMTLHNFTTSIFELAGIMIFSSSNTSFLRCFCIKIYISFLLLWKTFYSHQVQWNPTLVLM